LTWTNYPTLSQALPPDAVVTGTPAGTVVKMPADFAGMGDVYPWNPAYAGTPLPNDMAAYANVRTSRADLEYELSVRLDLVWGRSQPRGWSGFNPDWLHWLPVGSSSQSGTWNYHIQPWLDAGYRLGFYDGQGWGVDPDWWSSVIAPAIAARPGYLPAAYGKVLAADPGDPDQSPWMSLYSLIVDLRPQEVQDWTVGYVIENARRFNCTKVGLTVKSGPSMYPQRVRLYPNSGNGTVITDPNHPLGSFLGIDTGGTHVFDTVYGAGEWEAAMNAILLRVASATSLDWGGYQIRTLDRPAHDTTGTWPQGNNLPLQWVAEELKPYIDGEIA
jgi:hypothetical protein